MDDIYKRLGNVETYVSELRSQVSASLAIIPHLATKADLATAKAELKKIDLKADFTEVKTAIGERDHRQAALIKWFVGWLLAGAAWMFAIAKFVH